MFVKHDEVKPQIIDELTQRRILAAGGRLMMAEVSFKAGGIGSPHSHYHEQVSFIVAGSFEVQVGDNRSVLKRGDSFYVPPYVIHSVRALEDAIILDIFTPQREDFKWFLKMGAFYTMLADRYTDEGLKEILLPKDVYHPFPTADERMAWDYLSPVLHQQKSMLLSSRPPRIT